MTATLIFTIVLSAVVLAAIVGMLGWGIATQHVDSATRLPLGAAHRRRRTAAPARFLGRTVENRA
jgi:hypothetical protein